MPSKRKTSETCAELDKWSGRSGDSTASGTPSPDSTTTSDSDGSTHGLKHPERRRQGWQNCARRRRAAEAEAFHELELALPLPTSASQFEFPPPKELDKISMVRIALSYTKLRGLLQHLQPTTSIGESLLEYFGLDIEGAALLGQDAFLIIMTTNGDIVYVSDNVSRWLHNEKPAILGTSIYDHIQGEDRGEMERLLRTGSIEKIPACDGDGVLKGRWSSVKVHLCERQRGRREGAKGEEIHISGKLFQTKDRSFFVGIGEPPVPAPFHLAHPRDNRYPLPHPDFKIFIASEWVCTLEMKMLHTDGRLEQFLGYSPSEVLGVSGYEFIHPNTEAVFEECARRLARVGRDQSRCYQMLIKGGGWAWFVTRASRVQISGKTYLVGRDFMVSDVFERDKVVGAIQLGASPFRHPVEPLLNLSSEWAATPQPPTTPTEAVEDSDGFDYIDELLTPLLGG